MKYSVLFFHTKKGEHKITQVDDTSPFSYTNVMPKKTLFSKESLVQEFHLDATIADQAQEFSALASTHARCL